METNRLVLVSIWAPEVDKRSEWFCAFEIAGLGEDRVVHGHGIDAIQAIQSALRGIRRILERDLNRLQWTGGVGEIGFPRTIPDGFGVAFERKMEERIEREITRMTAPEKGAPKTRAPKKGAPKRGAQKRR